MILLFQGKHKGNREQSLAGGASDAPSADCSPAKIAQTSSEGNIDNSLTSLSNGHLHDSVTQQSAVNFSGTNVSASGGEETGIFSR